MARPPDPAEFDHPLTEMELKERVLRLSMLSPHHVADAYRQAYEACRMERDPLPRASAVQELVTTRKLLRKWRKCGPAPWDDPSELKLRSKTGKSGDTSSS